MNLTARLTRTLGSGPAATPRAAEPEPALASASLGHASPPAPRLADALARLDRARAKVAAFALAEVGGGPPRPFEDAVPGALEDTEAGPLWVAEERLGPGERHGSRAVGALRERSTDALHRLVGDERLRGFRAEDALFLDIEATGLDHGAGTLAFVVGLAYYEGETLVVRQLVLREPGEERALLLELKRALDRFPCLVSFNGKSYDTTVLENRLVMQRLYSPRETALKLRPHLDLLHLSRALYGGLWEDTRLQTLEREVLGVHREDDIPGHLVPSCWFTWLRHKSPDPIAGVVRHNRDDVLTMVTLADRLLAESALDGVSDLSPPLALNLARLLGRRGSPTDAARVLRGLPLSEMPPRLQLRALRESAICARRVGDHAWRREALSALVSRSPSDALAWEELALVLERERRLGEALVAARRAQHLLPTDAIARRLARLERRAAAS
ncbi:MAG: ribonuclease H-like domain-containing protein [Myxococcales bacterium]|nr:ribonuclease H-like domain-containing protein [Myxococcales bacterium]